MSSREERLETTIIHASTRGDFEQKTGAVNVPIYLSSTFHQESIDEFGPYDYSRSGNPTREALENTIAALEGGEEGWRLLLVSPPSLPHSCYSLPATI